MLAVFIIITLGLFASCTQPTPKTYTPKIKKKNYSKSFEESDFIFMWEYDFSEKKVIIFRGMVKKKVGSEVEEPVKLTISGLNAKRQRLNSSFADLDYLKIGEPEWFEIRVPKDGKEKSFLFTYEFDFYVDAGSGADVMGGWFEDSPNPAFIPIAVISPPEFKEGLLDFLK